MMFMRYIHETIPLQNEHSLFVIAIYVTGFGKCAWFTHPIMCIWRSIKTTGWHTDLKLSGVIIE